MPKAPRVIKGQGLYRSSPISIARAPTTTSITYPEFLKPEIPDKIMQSSQQYAMNNGGPVQPLHYPLPAQPRTTNSTAWTPQNDEILLNARAKGMNWQPIQAQYFPDKTPNACRKRHERLITARNTHEDWEGGKMKELAEQYIALREKIWKPLADQMNEKWMVVESKCMQEGIKNLQRLARTSNRDRENDQAAVQNFNSHVSHHNRHSTQLPPFYNQNHNRNSVGQYDGDDSGISVFEDTDNGYSPNNNQSFNRSSGEPSSFRSSGEYGLSAINMAESMGGRNEEQWNHIAVLHRADALRAQGGGINPQPPQPSYTRADARMDQRYTLQQSPGIPSTSDMRIPAIINGPNNSLNLNGLNGHHDSGMNRLQDPRNGMNGQGNGMGGQRQGNGPRS